MVEFEEPTSEGRERSGAEAAFTPTPDDLPMVVWLTGTEPWFDEFSLEADQVMNMLGIKRSRLTQIAGREMRVGRVRRGRYVSPVFRPADVEQYLAWVRAPASHVKSAGILNEAADALKTQSEELERQFSALRDDVTSDFAGVVNRNVHEAHALYRGLQTSMDAALTSVTDELRARTDFISRRQDELTTQVRLVAAAMEKLQAGQMTLLKALQEMQVRTAGELGDKIDAVSGAVAEGFELLRPTRRLAGTPAQDDARRERPVNWRLRTRNRRVAVDSAAKDRPVTTRARLLARAGIRALNEGKP